LGAARDFDQLFFDFAERFETFGRAGVGDRERVLAGDHAVGERTGGLGELFEFLGELQRRVHAALGHARLRARPAAYPRTRTYVRIRTKKRD
jgi:hypothetical protein